MAQQGLPIAISSVFVVLAMLASCEAATASFEPEYCAAGPGANSPPCHSPWSIPPDHRLVAETTGAWRLLRTPNPLGGADAVAITRTADTARSDADFAGLMLRCTETGPEALIILIVPLTPRAQPHVTFNSGGDRVMRLDGTVVLPGSSILLPRQAAVMLLGPLAFPRGCFDRGRDRGRVHPRRRRVEWVGPGIATADGELSGAVGPPSPAIVQSYGNGFLTFRMEACPRNEGLTC
jgi:hypothetical protein